MRRRGTCEGRGGVFSRVILSVVIAAGIIIYACSTYST